MSGQVTPFVVAVLGNLSGVPAVPLPRLRDRRFVTVTQESFSRFLAHIRPRLTPAIRSDAAPLGVVKLELTFQRVEDFLPENLSRQLQSANALEPDVARRVAGALPADEVFQALCGAWLGLKYLVDSQAKNPSVKVKVLDASKRDLIQDLQRAPKFDQSILFRRVYSEGIGTFGGEAIGCVVGDYYLRGGSEDAELAEKVSMVAAAAGAPFLCGARPDLLGAARWEDVRADSSPDLDHTPVLNERWQRRSEWADGWSIFVFLPNVRPVGGPPDASGPWSPDYAFFRRAHAWLNPAFLVGGAVADALGNPSLEEMAQRLFPHGSQPKDSDSEKGSARFGAAAEGSPAPVPGESHSADLDFECSLSPQAVSRLADLGLNALSPSTVKRQNLLQTLSPLAPAGRELPRSDLAQVLLCCSIVNRLHEYLHTNKRSERGAKLLEAARAWLAESVYQGLLRQCLLPFDHVSATEEGGTIRIQFSFLPVTSPPGRTTEFIFHIRQES
jgi:hypothetical protein